MPVSTLSAASAPRLRVRTILVIAAAVFAVYVPLLERSPVYLHDAEVQFGLQAHAIATTLRDANGRLLPLYFQMPAIGENVWFHPMLVYATAPFLKVLPFSESSIRLPAVFVGVVDVVLVYFVAWRIFRRELTAVAAALLLALSPAHFIHSRVAMDYLYPVPFILAWLLCLVIYTDSRRPALIFLAGLCLGVGFYSYIASVVMMPLYVILTLALLVAVQRRPARAHALVIAGFLLPLTLLVPWFLQHPTVYAETVTRYGLYNAKALNPVQGAKDFLNYNNVQQRVSLYWDFYNPGYLFFAGGSNFINSTRRAGVFLLPLALFLPVGVYQLATARRSPVGLLLLAGLLTAPVAAICVDEPYAVDRELGVLPFAALVAAVGVEHLLDAPARLWRYAALAALIVMPLQFAYFYRDYFTDYRVRSSRAFESNIRGAVQRILARDAEQPLSKVYLSEAIPYVSLYWKFYLTKYRRPELADRAATFDARSVDPAALPPHSVLLTLVADPATVRLASAPELRRLAVITEPDDSPSFEILER